MALSIGELVGYVDLDTGPAEKAKTKLDGLLGKASGNWGKILAGGGIAAGAAFATSLVGAMNLEPGRDRVAAALGLSEKQAEKSGQVAGALYADGWGESAEDVNLALESVMSSIGGMRKASESELAAVTESALTFATAMQVDVGKASQVAGQLIKNGLAADATEAFDLLTTASSKVPAELREDVLDAADEYGQFFASIGMDGPAAMSMLAKGAQQGMYGIDKAGDAVKEFTIRSTDMSTSSVAAYDAIGLNAHKMANDMLAGGGRAAKATSKIVDGLLGIKDPAKRANASIALFGTPLEDLNTKQIPAFLKSLKSGGNALGDWKGATEAAGDTLQDNASTNLTKFTRQLKSGFVSMIGGRVLPVVTDLTGKLADDLGPALELVAAGVSATVGWFQDHSTVAKVLAGVIGALVVVTAAHAAAMAVAAAGGMAAWLMQTKLISAATKVWAAVQWAMNAAMSANPIGLVVVAIAALVAAIVIAYKKSDTFRAVITAAFTAVRNVVGKVLAWFVKAIGKAIGWVRSNWKKIAALLAGPLGIAVALIVKHWDKIKSTTSKAIDKVIVWVKSIPGRATSALARLGVAIAKPFTSAMSGARNIVSNIGGTIVSWIRAIPGKLLSLAGRFSAAGAQLLQGFVNGMKNAAGIISGIAGNVWDTVRGLLNGAITRINRALEFTIKLPLGKSVGINPPDIPQLAGGGRATGSVLAEIGEGREPETVLPDSMLRGLLEKAHDAGAASARASDAGRSAPLIGAVYQSDGEDADTLAERLWFKTRTRG